MFAARLVARFLNFRGNRFSLSISRMSSVSHTLSFDTYDAYGFDIDHTLAKYNLPHLFTVCFRFALMTDIDTLTIARTLSPKTNPNPSANLKLSPNSNPETKPDTNLKMNHKP